VVAFQVRGVSEPTRHALSAEAKVRGESLQEYLLDLLDREARDIDNRRLLAELAAEPSMDAARRVYFLELIRAERERQQSQQLAGARSSVE
jgi:antitoxin FitA